MLRNDHLGGDDVQIQRTPDRQPIECLCRVSVLSRKQIKPSTGEGAVEVRNGTPSLSIPIERRLRVDGRQSYNGANEHPIPETTSLGSDPGSVRATPLREELTSSQRGRRVYRRSFRRRWRRRRSTGRRRRIPVLVLQYRSYTPSRSV